MRDEERARKESLQAGPIVRVATAKKAPEVKSVVLVGEARPYASVTVYAKISGYLQDIRVDKGDQIRADQVIAVLDSPELNKQYAAAIADARNKRADAERAQYLLKTGSTSAQNAETIETNARVAEDNAAAVKAQKDYEVIRGAVFRDHHRSIRRPGGVDAGSDQLSDHRVAVGNIGSDRSPESLHLSRSEDGQCRAGGRPCGSLRCYEAGGETFRHRDANQR